MRISSFAFAILALFSFTLLGCAGDGAGDDTVQTASPAPSTDNPAGVEEVAAVAVEDPCDCFSKGLSRGEQRYCRESKRDVRFSRPCASAARRR